MVCAGSLYRLFSSFLFLAFFDLLFCAMYVSFLSDGVFYLVIFCFYLFRLFCILELVTDVLVSLAQSIIYLMERIMNVFV